MICGRNFDWIPIFWALKSSSSEQLFTPLIKNKHFRFFIPENWESGSLVRSLVVRAT